MIFVSSYIQNQLGYLLNFPKKAVDIFQIVFIVQK